MESLLKNTPAIERFKALSNKEKFPIDLLPDVLRLGIDIAKASRGVKKAKTRVERYETEVKGYKSGAEMIEVGRMIGQDLVNSPDPNLLRGEYREVIRLAHIKQSDRMYGGDY